MNYALPQECWQRSNRHMMDELKMRYGDRVRFLEGQGCTFCSIEWKWNAGCEDKAWREDSFDTAGFLVYLRKHEKFWWSSKRVVSNVSMEVDRALAYVPDSLKLFLRTLSGEKDQITAVHNWSCHHSIVSSEGMCCSSPIRTDFASSLDLSV